MSTIERLTEPPLTVSQIDKRLAMYARRLAGNVYRTQTVEDVTLEQIRLTREQALFNVDVLLDLRLELVGAAA